MSYEEKRFKTFREAYRIKSKGIRSSIKIVHTTERKINYNIFYDGVFIVDSEYSVITDWHTMMEVSPILKLSTEVIYPANIMMKISRIPD